MIFERSIQARFLIPMAISLGFGILVASAIVLILVPSIYVAVEDVRGLIRSARETPNQEERRKKGVEAAPLSRPEGGRP